MHMGDKATEVQQMFAAIAGKYDLLNSLLSFGRDSRWRELAVSKCNLGPGDLALDVATGTGEMARLLARRYGDSRVVGVDFCADMLARARTKLATSAGGERIHLVRGDALRLPFPDCEFDCAIIGFALRNVSDIAAVCREMARVVKPGGRVVSLELTRPSSRLLRAMHRFYMFQVISRIGGLMSGRREAYTYLPESILEFPPPEELKGIMEGAGLEKVETYRLTLGAATVHVGTKRGRPLGHVLGPAVGIKAFGTPNAGPASSNLSTSPAPRCATPRPTGSAAASRPRARAHARTWESWNPP